MPLADRKFTEEQLNLGLSIKGTVARGQHSSLIWEVFKTYHSIYFNSNKNKGLIFAL